MKQSTLFLLILAAAGPLLSACEIASRGRPPFTTSAPTHVSPQGKAAEAQTSGASKGTPSAPTPIASTRDVWVFEKTNGLTTSKLERVDDVPAAGDPELELMKHEYRREFRDALAAAATALDAKERTLLRLALVDGLTVGAIGEL